MEDPWGLSELLEGGAVLSFPHTALAYSAPLILPLAAALYRLPAIKRVIALGVLHLGALPEPFRRLSRVFADPSAAEDEIAEAFAALAGGFVPSGKVILTPFGEVPIGRANLVPPLREDHGVLAREFSLDTFFALLAYVADRLGRPPLPVLAVYVGLTRNPLTGGFGLARELARALSPLLGPGTALVATGDVVHYGRPYGDVPGDDGLPQDPSGLERHFRGELERVLGLALAERDYAQAYRISEGRLKSDQRQLLPVIAELLGPGAGFRVLAFGLSDYAPIFGVVPPCLVASALIALLT